MRRYFLDPKNRRGELKVGRTRYWLRIDGSPGCHASLSLLTTLKNYQAASAFYQGQGDSTALLPWEV